MRSHLTEPSAKRTAIQTALLELWLRSMYFATPLPLLYPATPLPLFKFPATPLPRYPSTPLPVQQSFAFCVCIVCGTRGSQ
jgi:hypothetical protein